MNEGQTRQSEGEVRSETTLLGGRGKKAQMAGWLSGEGKTHGDMEGYLINI